MKRSAGILVYRIRTKTEVLLVHPGGPFWKKKDEGVWSIPKGEIKDNEEPFSAARREFYEETGIVADGNFFEMEPVKQPGGKVIFPWAVEGDMDISTIKSNVFTLEWPPKSGNILEFPEIDRAAWFTMEIAKIKILRGQLPILEHLIKMLSAQNRKNDE